MPHPPQRRSRPQRHCRRQNGHPSVSGPGTTCCNTTSGEVVMTSHNVPHPPPPSITLVWAFPFWCPGANHVLQAQTRTMLWTPRGMETVCTYSVFTPPAVRPECDASTNYDPTLSTSGGRGARVAPRREEGSCRARACLCRNRVSWVSGRTGGLCGEDLGERSIVVSFRGDRHAWCCLC